MKINRILQTIILISLTFYSCQNEDDYSPNNQPQTVHFTSDVSYRVTTTKAANSSWENGDKVGVFMKSAGIDLADPSIVNGASNKIYRTSGNGIFEPESTAQTIYYPEDNAKVDFIAYYPYRADIANYIYKVDISDQSNPQAIDLLYANNLVEASYNNPKSSLSFTHQLSTLNLNISIINNDIAINDLVVSMAGIKTLADFDLKDGTLSADANSMETVNLKTSVTTTSVSTQAILLPDEGGAGRTITFNLPSVGKNFKWSIPAETKLEKGRKYTYNIKLDGAGIVVEEEKIGWIETPKMKNLADDLMYITHMISDNKVRNYAMLYDTKYKLAYWVAYPLHAYYLGSQDRTNKWAYDPSVASFLQPNLTSSYQESNLDRGHQIPSGDRTRDYASNIQTFYYTNMTAQVGQGFNQTIWADLETQVRTWTSRCDTMYVVTGAMITTSTDKNIEYAHDASGAQIAKPKYHYKALAQRHGNTYYTLAFKMDNIRYSDRNFNKYRITVEQLEKETGFEFFPSIPLEAKKEIVSSQWN